MQLPEDSRLWWHFLWCGSGVGCDSHLRPWNVSGLLGSVGWPGCGEAATQRAHSHIPPGPPGKHGGRLPSGSALAFSWEWIPGFLGAWEAQRSRETLLLAQGQGQSCRSSLWGGCWTSKGIIVLGGGKAFRQRVGAWGRLLNCIVLIWPCQVHGRIPSSFQVCEGIRGKGIG